MHLRHLGSVCRSSKYYLTDRTYSMQTDKKSAILQFIADHPGVKSIEINIGLSRASIGAHTKVLLDRGLLIRDSSEGWHVANGYVVKTEPKSITPLDIAAECIRKMIDVNKR